MQKRNLFVYCVKTATFPLAACYTLARLFEVKGEKSKVKTVFEDKRTKEQKSFSAVR